MAGASVRRLRLVRRRSLFLRSAILGLLPLPYQGGFTEVDRGLKIRNSSDYLDSHEVVSCRRESFSLACVSDPQALSLSNIRLKAQVYAKLLAEHIMNADNISNLY